MAVFIIAALLLGWSAYWAADEAFKRYAIWRTGGSSSLAVSSKIARDTWLQDAILYAVHGRWLGEEDDAYGEEGQISEAGRVIRKMRELAGDDRLIIWGKLAPTRLHEKIPPEYWIDYQIDMLHALAGEREQVKTEKASYGSSKLVYSELMCSKTQVEELCRAGSI